MQFKIKEVTVTGKEPVYYVLYSKWWWFHWSYIRTNHGCQEPPKKTFSSLEEAKGHIQYVKEVLYPDMVVKFYDEDGKEKQEDCNDYAPH